MSAPLSVIIPTLNAAAQIGPTLGALVPGAADGLIREVILADGGSGDAIEEIAEHAGARLVPSPPGRGQQLHAGAEAARGGWLLFLHADTLPTGDWIGEIRTHIQRHPGKAAYFRLRFDAEGFGARWTEGWANARARIFALPYGDQGLLIPQALYDELGGYSPIPLMEDVALIRKIGRNRLRPLPVEALTSAQKYQKEGWLRRGFRNWRCMALHVAGASPERIARIYRR